MFRIGIIGAGWIARKMAVAIAPSKEMEIYAISSRSITKAEAFAREFGIPAAYGSYEEMTRYPEVDLVYIATPHSHHFEHTRLSLLKGKPVLCEKAFTANAWQAEELLKLAKEKKLFLTEAIWTRYMPLSRTINRNSQTIVRQFRISQLSQGKNVQTRIGRWCATRLGSLHPELRSYGIWYRHRTYHIRLHKIRYGG